jgi:hypothetical protein
LGLRATIQTQTQAPARPMEMERRRQGYMVRGEMTLKNQGMGEN